MSLKDNLVSKHLLFQGKNPGNEYINHIRELGIESFDKSGFPTIKDEEWKYTNLKTIIHNKEYKLFPENDSALDYKDIKHLMIHDIESYKIVFVNGVYSNFLSKTTHDEADICILSSAFDHGVYQPVIENYFNQVAEHKNSLFQLNSAFGKEGAYIHIPNNTILSKPIEILHFSTAKEQEVMYQPRNLVLVGDNAEVKIIERHQTINHKDNLTNAVTEIVVGENAKLEYYKIQNDTDHASLIDQTFIRQEKNSVAQVHTFSFGGKLTRNNLHFYQKGENCNSILHGISLTNNNQLIDHHTLVDHAFANCESHELYRGVFADQSKGVFNGKVIVHSEAQKINAFQQNNNILLSNEASIDTKPQLEIFADDVKCSHGCTVGQLDKDAMFYMQSRGIPQKEARALLMFAFAADVLEGISIPQIKNRINTIIAEKLGVEIEFDW